jgi:hypothetical protein
VICGRLSVVSEKGGRVLVSVEECAELFVGISSSSGFVKRLLLIAIS